jgi:NitT/TauT family transport system substrate-binding protein
MKRFTLIYLLLLLGLFSANIVSAQNLKSISLGTTGKTIATVPFEVSVQRGYFKEQGLDVRQITINQSDVIVRAIVANELQFMSIIPTAILATVRGIPVQTIAVNVESAPYVLVGTPGVKSMSDMKGKKVGVSSLVGMSTNVVREIVAKNGLNPERDVTFIAVGGSGARSAALAAGFVDAALVTIPLNYELERKGFTRLAWGPDFVRYPLNGIAASTEFLPKNRLLAISLLKGLAAGVRDVKQRKAETIAFIKKYLSLQDEDATSSYEFLVANSRDDLIADDPVIQSAINFAAQSLKLKPESVSIDKVRDWSYAKAIK